MYQGRTFFFKVSWFVCARAKERKEIERKLKNSINFMIQQQNTPGISVYEHVFYICCPFVVLIAWRSVRELPFPLHL